MTRSMTAVTNAFLMYGAKTSTFAVDGHVDTQEFLAQCGK
jgi:hypothetical protein